jgi:hypothetical protein
MISTDLPRILPGDMNNTHNRDRMIDRGFALHLVIYPARKAP